MIMNSLTNLSPQQLRQAADIQERINVLQEGLSRLLGGAPAELTTTSSGRRKLSAQGLANIRAGAQRRWAKFNRAGKNGSGAPKRRGGMSPAGRAAIAARMRARWAAAKRAGRNAL